MRSELAIVIREHGTILRATLQARLKTSEALLALSGRLTWRTIAPPSIVFVFDTQKAGGLHRRAFPRSTDSFSLPSDDRRWRALLTLARLDCQLRRFVFRRTSLDFGTPSSIHSSPPCV